jgi:hypothetical protein
MTEEFVKKSGINGNILREINSTPKPNNGYASTLLKKNKVGTVNAVYLNPEDFEHSRTL